MSEEAFVSFWAFLSRYPVPAVVTSILFNFAFVGLIGGAVVGWCSVRLGIGVVGRYMFAWALVAKLACSSFVVAAYFVTLVRDARCFCLHDPLLIFILCILAN